MLIMTRKPGEKIVIPAQDLPEDVTIQVLEVNGKQVRLGAKAPKSVVIHRLEVHQRDNGKEVAVESRDSDTQS